MMTLQLWDFNSKTKNFKFDVIRVCLKDPKMVVDGDRGKISMERSFVSSFFHESYLLSLIKIVPERVIYLTRL